MFHSLAVTRAPRGNENRLHLLMDVVYHDDLMRLSPKTGLPYLQHCPEYIKQMPDKASIKV